MPLSDIELRVLGALIEKERTTPDGYPLSSQALLTACNQRTNREPVSDYHLQDVLAAVGRLGDRGLAETVQGAGDRVAKHRHRAASALGLSDPETAVLAVLLLRGAQTPGELRARTERYVRFGSVDEVSAVLAGMAARSPALVRRLGRGPGQSQDRYAHTLGHDEERLSPRVRRSGESNGGRAGQAAERAEASAGASRAVAIRAAASGGLEGRVAELESESTRLDSQLSRLMARVTALEDGRG